MDEILREENEINVSHENAFKQDEDARLNSLVQADDFLLQNNMQEQSELPVHLAAVKKGDPLANINNCMIRLNAASRTGNVDSFAMKLVKEYLTEIEIIKTSEDLTAEERERRLIRSVTGLEFACKRYKKSRFADGKAKNDRHRIVDEVLKNAQTFLEHQQKPVLETSLEYTSARVTLRKLGGKSAFSDMYAKLKELDAVLAEKIPHTDVEFKNKTVHIEKTYRALLSSINTYLSDNNRYTFWTRKYYRMLEGVQVQLQMEYDRFSGCSERKSEKTQGYSWENILNCEGRIITENEINKGYNMEKTRDGRLDFQMSLLAKTLGVECYANYEKGTLIEKKDGKEVRKAVSVTKKDDSYFSLNTILREGKKDKLEVIYSPEVLFTLSKIQIIDLIAGVEKRGEDSLGFRFTRKDVLGRKVIELTDVKVLYTKQAFSKKKTTDFNYDKKKNRYRISDPFAEKPLVISGYDLDFADKLIKDGSADLMKKLSEAGFDTGSTERLRVQDRADEIIALLEQDAKTGKRSEYYKNKNYKTATKKEKEEARKKVLKDIYIDRNESLYLIDRQLVGQGVSNRNFTKMNAVYHGEMPKEKESGTTPLHEFANAINKQTDMPSSSYVKRANAKDAMAEAVHKAFDRFLVEKTPLEIQKERELKLLNVPKVKNENGELVPAFEVETDKMKYEVSPALLALRDDILAYTRIHVTAAGMSEELSVVYRKKRYKKMNEQLLSDSKVINPDVLFPEEAPFEEPQVALIDMTEEEARAAHEDALRRDAEEQERIQKKSEEYANAPKDGKRAINNEAEMLLGLMERIKTMKQELSTKNDPQSVKELDCIKELEKLFGFTNGNLKVSTIPADKLITDDHYNFKLTNNKGTWKDMSKYPLFSHEPCLEDVRQANIGDCYLIASIASLVEHDPKAVKDMMYADETHVTVKLHDLKGREHYFRMKKTIPVKEDGVDAYARGISWVQYLEKAYVMANFCGKYVGPLTTDVKKKDGTTEKKQNRYYAAMDGGYSENAMYILTGKKPVNLGNGILAVSRFGRGISLDHVNRYYKVQAGQLVQKIRRSKESGRFMTAAFAEPMNKVQGGVTAEPEGHGLYGRHAYAVLGTEQIGGKDMIKLYNPWGGGRVVYDVQRETGMLITRWDDVSLSGAFYVTPEHFLTMCKSLVGA